jgi:hypothetical protein
MGSQKKGGSIPLMGEKETRGKKASLGKPRFVVWIVRREA